MIYLPKYASICLIIPLQHYLDRNLICILPHGSDATSPTSIVHVVCVRWGGLGGQREKKAWTANALQQYNSQPQYIPVPG